MSIPESTRKKTQKEGEKKAFMTTHYEGSPNKKQAHSESGGVQEVQKVKSHETVHKRAAAIIPKPAPTRRQPSRLTNHIAPANYSAVIPGALYRSAFPQAENFSFLRSLKLKTILTLVEEPFPPEFVEFMKTHGIKQIVVPLPANKEIIMIEDAMMLKALGVALDPGNYPLLIHCNKGKHRTGCTVACLSKLRGDSLQSVLYYYHTHAREKARSLDEDYIRSFDAQRLRNLVTFRQPNETVVESPRPGMFARLRG
ncbi:ATP-binding cassette transporter [Venturia nashicola]|uniref:diphosphoinositol-polyphosphate diphosphatase n=1 Tax=Venturia nashicola TaxID=86259 RepID=A0A4Z1NR57_9PEZI|nr:ATP-binding cassette transporter [Venturia nashicola]